MQWVKPKDIASDRRWKLLLSIVVLVVVPAALVREEQPRALASVAAAPTLFSYHRAMADLRAIGVAQRPLGSPGHDQAREYVLQQLSSLNLRAGVDTQIVALPGNPVEIDQVQNIETHIRGTHNTRSILLVAHYDSVPHSPGAADNASGVAIVLEILRTLKARPALRNDVVALFSDAEEVGSLGAGVFLRESTYTQSIGLVINLEARGNRGPSLMFETSMPNAWLIKAAAHVQTPPLASSMMPEAYALLPNGTDLSTFKRAGISGVNFAYVDGAETYHSAMDTPERLDQRALEQQGQNVFELVHYFGEQDLSITEAGNVDYFNLPGHILVYYSRRWTFPLAWITTALLAFAIWAGISSQRITVRLLLRGVLLALVCFVLSTAFSFFILQFMNRNHIYGRWMLLNAHVGLFTLGLVALAYSLSFALYERWRGTTRPGDLIVGAALWWLVLLLVACRWAEGAAYLFIWPLLAMAVGQMFTYLHLRRKPSASSPPLLPLLLALPALLLVVPPLALLVGGLGFDAVWIISGLATLLIVSWLVPAALHALPESGRAFSLLALGLSLVCLVTAFFSSRHNRNTPEADSVFYVSDASGRRAMWVSADPRADEWVSQFVSSEPLAGRLFAGLPYLDGKYLYHSAPFITVAQPLAELVAERRAANRRAVRIRLSGGAEAQLFRSYFSPNVQLLRVEVGDQKLLTEDQLSGSKPNMLFGRGIGRQALEVTAELPADERLSITMVSETYQLPQELAKTYRPRPDYLIVTPYSLSDSTLVTRNFVF